MEMLPLKPLSIEKEQVIAEPLINRKRYLIQKKKLSTKKGSKDRDHGDQGSPSSLHTVFFSAPNAVSPSNFRPITYTPRPTHWRGIVQNYKCLMGSQISLLT
jgi:hypothetical protein